MKHRSLNFQTMFFVLVVFFAVSSPLPVLGSTAEVVLQWGFANWLGVGPRAVGEQFIPPTPTGVFDDHYTVPLDGNQYLRATNGPQTLLIVRKNGYNQWFLSGEAISGTPQPLPTTYRSPVDITHTLDGGPISLKTTPILKVELLETMIAVVIDFDPQNNVSALVTFSTSDLSSGMPLGRLGPDTVPDIVAYRSYNDRNKLFLACGHCYCFYANATNGTLISSEQDSCYGALNNIPELDFTSSPIRNVFPYFNAFMILHENNSFTAFGSNQNTRFGGANGSLSYPDGVTLPKSIPNLVDGACGAYHCIFLQSTGTLLGVGTNAHGECGRDLSAPVVEYFSEGDPLKPMDLSSVQNFGVVKAVGAVISASFALTDTGLWAWGGPLGHNNGLSESSFLYGFTYSYAGGTWSAMKNPLIPPGITVLEAPRLSTFKMETPPITMAIGVRASMSLTDYNALGRTSTLLPSFDIPPNTMSTLIAWGSHTGATAWGQGGPPLGSRSLNSYSMYAKTPVVVEIPYTDNTGVVNSVAVGPSGGATYATATGAPYNLFAWGHLPSIEITSHLQPTTYPSNIRLQGQYLLSIAQAKDFMVGVYRTTSVPNEIYYLTSSSLGQEELPMSRYVTNPNQAGGSLKCGDYHCGYLDSPGASQGLLLWSNSSTLHASKPPLCRPASDNRPLQEPVAVLGANSILDFALGSDFTVFVVRDGATGSKLYGCGNAASGQIPGSTNTVDTATYLTGTDGIMQVTAGKSHIIGVTGGGAVYAWGKNDFGQAGDVYTNPTSNPHVIGSPLTSVSWVAAVQDTSFAMNSNGDLWVWGRNDYMNMFGDPHLQGYARSYVPLKTEIQNAMGVKGKINQIFSSSFAWQVYARMTPTQAGPLTNVQTFKAFWGGYDPLKLSTDKSIISPTNAEFISTSNEMATPTLDGDEYIVDANLGAGFISYVTNTRRIFIAGRNTNNGGTPIFAQNFVDNRQDNFAPRLALPNPIFAWQHPEPVKKIQNTELGVLILQEDGVLKSLDKSTGLVSASPVMSGTFAEIDCVTSSGSSTSCGYLDSNGNLSLWSLTSQNSLLNITDVDHFALVGSYHTVNSLQVQVLIVSGNQILVQDVSNSNNYQVVNGNFPSSATVVKVVGGYDYWLILSDEGKLYGIGNSVNFGLPSTAGIDSGVQPVYHAELNGVRILDMAASTRMSFVLSDVGVYGWGILPSAYTYNFTKIDDLSTNWPNLAATSPVLMPLPVLKKLGITNLYKSYKPLVGGIATCKEDGVVLDASYNVKDAYLMWRNVPPFIPAPIACAPPPTIDPAWTCNEDTGVLFYNGTFTVPIGQATTISGPISIDGDFNVPAGASLQIAFNRDIKARLNSETPLINVSGCAQVNESMEINLDNDAKKVLSKQKGGATVDLVESSCKQTPGQLLVNTPPSAQKGCRRYTAQQSETENGRRSSVSVILTISHDTCNHWWIILVSVLCSVIVVVIIVVLLVMFTPLKGAVLPYFKSN